MLGRAYGIEIKTMQVNGKLFSLRGLIFDDPPETKNA